MRILAIRGENLASLQQPFTIDFRNEPLRSAGLYAITGPTGAGKSTILDAICLALFDRVPRLLHARESGAQIIDASGERIAASDPRVLLRKGAHAAYAEVEFLGIDHIEYRARWETHRAGKKPNGRLQTSEISILRIDRDEPLPYKGKTECLQRIEEKLGLGFEQFTRAVLLAQGDFAKFLQAKTKEKAELLERLTGTERFSRISVEIHQQHARAQRDVDDLLLALQQHPTLPEEDLAVLQTQTQEAANRVEKLIRDEKTCALQLDLLTRHQQVEQQIQQAAERVRAQTERLQALDPDRALLLRWDQAQTIRDDAMRDAQHHREIQNLRAQHQQLAQALNQTATLRAQAEDGSRKAESAQQRIDEQAKQLNIQLEESAALQSAIRAQEKLHAANSLEHREWRERLQRLTDELRARENQIEKLHREHAARSQRLARLNRGATLFQEDARPIQLMATHLQLATQLATLQQELQQKQRQLQRANQAAQELLHPAALALRELLKPNTPCPVCGATTHPYPTREIPPTPTQNTHQQPHAENHTLELQKREALRESISQLTGAATQRAHDIEKLHHEIQPLLAQTMPDWEEKLQIDPHLPARLRELHAEWRALREQVERDAITLQHKREQLPAMRAQQREATEKLNLLTAQKTQIEHDLNAKTQQLHQLLRGCTPDELRKAHQQRAHSAQQDVQKWRQALTKAQTDTHALLGQQRALQTLLQEHHAQQEQTANRIRQWLNLHPDIPSPKALSDILSIPPQHAAQKRDAIRLAENDLLASRNILAERHAQREALPAPQDPNAKPDTLKARLLEITRSLKQARTTHETLLARLAHERIQIQAANEIKNKLHAQRENLHHWKQLNELYGSADGNRFRVMAQTYTLQLLLRHANHHLNQIMPRYQLQPIPSQQDQNRQTLAIQILDQDLLRETRPADTLSGGETFLVSLALALALAAFTSSAYSIQSLFIDEGFGALDPEALAIAITALERLQIQGRKIGIISHIHEINERIPVKIRVQKMAAGQSRILTQTL